MFKKTQTRKNAGQFHVHKKVKILFCVKCFGWSSLLNRGIDLKSLGLLFSSESTRVLINVTLKESYLF